ncbi:hypothetical protein GCM10009547_33550 [Sporichthya brevicatena]|uniref:Glutamyl-tRNA amidotransferase n=1 Tax=Sporichthya brevicatena TaxID=171442 RepID=A0ABN1H376_9ACTN
MTSDLRARLRADLVAAMKAKPEVVSALRTTLAAIDNAEAIVAAHAAGRRAEAAALQVYLPA